MPDTPHHHAKVSPRPLFVIAVAVAVVSFILTLSYGFADHAPAPHGVRIAVAAPASLTHELTAGLAHAAPGGFTVVSEPSAGAVTSSVLSQSTAGGLVAGPAGPVTIVTAGRGGAGEPAAGGQRGAHRRGDRAPPPGPSPRRRATSGRRPRGRVRLRLRTRPAHPERDREHRPVPGRPALPAVVAGHRRGRGRAAGRLRERVRARPRPRRPDRRERGPAGHRLPRLADVRRLHHRLPGGHRAARDRPGRARLHLRR